MAHDALTFVDASVTSSEVLKKVSTTNRFPVEATIAESVGGGVIWAAPVAVAMTGASKTFVPADATRKALKMWNLAANAAAGFDDAGGTVVLLTALQLVPGAAPVIYTGAETPVGIVTAIGTNTQNIYYQSGN